MEFQYKTMKKSHLFSDYEIAEDIIRICSQYQGYMVELIKSKSRLRDVSWCRKACFFLIRKHTNLTLIDVGKFFNYRDHSTVSKGVDDIANLPVHDKFYPSLLKMVNMVGDRYSEYINPKFEYHINK